MKGIAVLLPVLVALQVGVQPALAWTWPVDGPVLRPFVLGDDPYAGGQHRGIDIGAPPGALVRAPAAGAVSFAGSVPTGGRTVTIRTDDGFAVTLLHLGTYSVARGAVLGEGDAVGTVGDGTEPFIYLGVRTANDPDGYVDPLGLLPAPVTPPQEPAEPEPAPDPVPAPGSDPNQHVATPVLHPASSRAHGGAEEPSATARPARERSVRPKTARGRGRPAPATRIRNVAASWSPRPAAADSGFVRAARPAAESSPASSRSLRLACAAAIGGVGLCVLGLGARLARRRRELGHARLAHGPAAMLAQGASLAAEDADGLRLGQENDVVLDRDLERILLAQGEALANLDRDNDPAEIVDVADDPRSRRSSGRARGRGSLGASVRPHVTSSPRSRRASSNTSPRVAVSNHDFRSREGVACFV